MRRGDAVDDAAAAIEADSRGHAHADGIVHRQSQAAHRRDQLAMSADSGAAAGEGFTRALEDGDVPAALTSTALTRSSSLIKVSNCSGVIVIGSAPSLETRSRTSGTCRATVVLRYSRSISSRGVFAGTNRP